MTIQVVPQGRLKTPFYERMSKIDTINTWHEWKGYSTPDELYCSETEYFEIRNATAVFDVSPMTKYRITGPDSLTYMNRLVTRDMAKIKPGRVAYAVWCDDQGQVLDDGTIFHLREGEYRLCSQERHYDWFLTECDFALTLAKMKLQGIALDRKKLAGIREEAREVAAGIQEKWDKLALFISITSAAQLQTLF